MFVAVGQVERKWLGREAFQEIDQVGSLGRLAKWAAEPHTAAEVATAMAEATRQALGGRPGPAYLSLPEDLLDEPMPDDVKADTARPGQSRATDDEIRAVIELLASARRPVILAGAGVLRARTSTELTRFAELLQVPVIGAWRRADVISNDHPLYLGMSGLRGRVVGQGAPRRRRRPARHRLPTQRGDVVRLHDAATGPALGARRPRAGRPRRIHRPRDRGRGRRQGASSRPPTSGWSGGPCSTPLSSRSARPPTARIAPPMRLPRSSTRSPGTAPASIPAVRSRPSGRSCPTTRS